jgi:glycosyltransferase involved in cell wall biosynthesis
MPDDVNIHGRVRCLLIAEAANPEWASVPLIGWSFSKAIFDIADAHIVTQVRNRDAILRAGLVEGRDFTAIDTEPLMRPLWRLASLLRGDQGVAWTTATAISSVAYPYFERLVWKRFKKDISSGRYDIVHRITPLSPTAPSLLARKCAKAGVPFIAGPLNGGVPWPKGFDGARRKEREWLSYVRGLYKLLPGYRSTYKHAAAVLAASRFTLGDMPDAYREKYIFMQENGIDPSRFAKRARAYAGAPLRACFVGRLVPYKGPDMLLEAAAPLLREGLLELDIIGDGPMRERLSTLAAELGIEGRTRFHGWVKHEQIQDIMAESQVLAFPSIREFGGGVVLEAMALGVVPLVVDYAGPGELVDDAVGVKVPMQDRAGLIEAFGERLGALVRDPDGLARMSQACIARIASEFTWQRKAERMRRIYRECIERRGSSGAAAARRPRS